MSTGRCQVLTSAESTCSFCERRPQPAYKGLGHLGADAFVLEVGIFVCLAGGGGDKKVIDPGNPHHLCRRPILPLVCEGFEASCVCRRNLSIEIPLHDEQRLPDVPNDSSRVKREKALEPRRVRLPAIRRERFPAGASQHGLL